VPLKNNPITLAAKNTVKEKNKVTANELVTVNENGNRPATFHTNRFKNKKNTTPKFVFFCCNTFSFNKPDTRPNKEKQMNQKNEKPLVAARRGRLVKASSQNAT